MTLPEQSSSLGDCSCGRAFESHELCESCGHPVCDDGGDAHDCICWYIDEERRSAVR
jgi:hypothetical protein